MLLTLEDWTVRYNYPTRLDYMWLECKIAAETILIINLEALLSGVIFLWVKSIVIL